MMIAGRTGEWEVVIGLEVHAQVVSNAKLFSSAATAFGAEPNAQVSFVDAAFPGMLPVLNQVCVAQAIRTGLALNATVNETSVFARKNYFYADLPQGYQISQYELPIVSGGHVMITLADGATKRIGVTRLHLEQDAGKSLHDQHPAKSFIDLNRAGIALMEIVSEPDLRSPEEAGAYLKKLRAILRYVGSCDGNMEEGSMRCDANVSVRRPGDPLGTRCEIKNVNSIRYVMQAIEHEARRQVDLIEEGGAVDQETRLWDVARGMTRAMRSKEQAHDYRYFPDPDLLPLTLTAAEIAAARADLPELPDQRMARYVAEFGLSPYDAAVLSAEQETATYYETVAAGRDAKLAANWVIGELFGALNRVGRGIEDPPVAATALGELLDLLSDQTLSGKLAKDVFAEMVETGQTARAIVDAKGLRQVTDIGAIDAAIDAVMTANADKVAEIRAGKEKLMGWLVGQVMKATGGKANPAMLNERLKSKILGSIPPSVDEDQNEVDHPSAGWNKGLKNTITGLVDELNRTNKDFDSLSIENEVPDFFTARNGETVQFNQAAKAHIRNFSDTSFKNENSLSSKIDFESYVKVVREVIAELYASNGFSGLNDMNQGKFIGIVKERIEERFKVSSSEYTHYFPAWTLGIEAESPFEIGPVTFLSRSEWIDSVNFPQWVMDDYLNQRDANHGWKEILKGALENPHDRLPIEGLASVVYNAIVKCPAVVKISVRAIDLDFSRKTARIVAKAALDCISLGFGDSKYFHQQALHDERLPPFGTSMLVETNGLLWRPGSSFGKRVGLPDPQEVSSRLTEIEPLLQAFGLVLQGLVEPSRVAHPKLCARWATALDWFAEGNREASEAIAIAKLATCLDVLSFGGKYEGIKDMAVHFTGLKQEDTVIYGNPPRTLAQLVKDVYNDGRSKILHGTHYDRLQSFGVLRQQAERLAGELLILYAIQLESYTGPDDDKGFCRLHPSEAAPRPSSRVW